MLLDLKSDFNKNVFFVRFSKRRLFFHSCSSRVLISFLGTVRARVSRALARVKKKLSSRVLVLGGSDHMEDERNRGIEEIEQNVGSFSKWQKRLCCK